MSKFSGGLLDYIVGYFVLFWSVVFFIRGFAEDRDRERPKHHPGTRPHKRKK